MSTQNALCLSSHTALKGLEHSRCLPSLFSQVQGLQSYFLLHWDFKARDEGISKLQVFVTNKNTANFISCLVALCSLCANTLRSRVVQCFPKSLYFQSNFYCCLLLPHLCSSQEGMSLGNVRLGICWATECSFG